MNRSNTPHAHRPIEESLQEVIRTPSCVVSEITSQSRFPVRRLVASTAQTRAICNDPFVVGLNYTDGLEAACAAVLGAIGHRALHIEERTATVLHILRGGLNFGLRQALGKAYGWNTHASAFISAQRARETENPEEWYITESAYRKVYLPEHAAIIFGDVVATGTSLGYALKQIIDTGEDDGRQISSLVFFTIGGPRSEEILSEIDETCRARFSEYRGATVVYFEGRFAVADPETPISIKLTGTDLLRRESLLAADFLESQYENPAYPLERCTIYDAGSRAFWLPEYLEDVEDYWHQVAALARAGMTFETLLNERFPQLDATRFASVSLGTLCERQLSRCRSIHGR